MPKKQTTDWTVFISKVYEENKGMARADVMAKASEAWGKMSAEQKKSAGKASMRSDWASFLAEFTKKNQGTVTEGDDRMMAKASEAWKKMSDAQKAKYGPKK